MKTEPSIESNGPKGIIHFRQVTNVNNWVAATLGLAVTLTLYGLTWGLLRNFEVFPLYTYLLDRGWIPFVITYCFGFAIGILVLKVFRVRKERGAFRIADEQVFYRAESGKTSFGNQDAREFVQRIRELSHEHQQLMLINRLARATHRIKNAQSSSEVDELIASLSKIDASIIETSYTMLRFLTGFIPILGFLGTVYGIGMSIATFTNVLEVANSFEAVKPSLSAAADGLGIAFDTTLLALLFSGILLLVTAVVQKREEDVLSAVDDYCINQLVARVHIPGRFGDLVQGQERMGADVRGAVLDQTDTLKTSIEQVLPEALRQHVDEVLAQGLGIVNGHLADIAQQLKKSTEGEKSGMEQLMSAVERELRRIRSVIEEARAGVEERAQRPPELSTDTFSKARPDAKSVEGDEKLSKAIRELSESLARPFQELSALEDKLGRLVERLQPIKGLAGSLKHLEQLGNSVAELQETLKSLAPTIDRLSEETARGVRLELNKLLRLLAMAHHLSPSPGLPSEQDIDTLFGNETI